MSTTIPEPFVNYLPPSLREVYSAEILFIQGGRKEILDTLKARIDTELKLVKDGLALVPPPPQDANYTRSQVEAATAWYKDMKADLDSALADAKEEKAAAEEQLKLQAELPTLTQQQAEAQIAKLKDLQKQREALNTQIENLCASIATAKEKGLNELVASYQEEKTKLETALQNLDDAIEDTPDDIQAAIDEWRAKHEAYEAKITERDGLLERAIEVETIMKNIAYFNTYKDDIIDQWLQTEYPPEQEDPAPEV